MRYLALVLLLFTAPVWAKEVTFMTQDSIRISATYRMPKVTKDTYPAVILIHQGGSSRQEWLGLPMVHELLDSGYAILAYDIRNHGQSGSDGGTMRDLFVNPNRAPYDLQAALLFLARDPKIDAQRIGIIGASIGANLACVASSYISEYFRVKVIVALSPKTAAVDQLSDTKNPIEMWNAFYIASIEEQDGMRAQWAKELYNRTLNAHMMKIAPGDQHGSYILREHRPIQDLVVRWITHLL